MPDTARSSSILRLSPTAWAKLLYLCVPGRHGGRRLRHSAADDLLLVEDIQLVRQACSGASVAFDDESVADFFDRQVDPGEAQPFAPDLGAYPSRILPAAQYDRRRDLRPGLRPL